MESKRDHDKASFQKYWRPWLQMWKKSSRLHNKISVGTPGLQNILSASWCTLLVWRQIKMKSLRDDTLWCAPAEGQVWGSSPWIACKARQPGGDCNTQNLDQRFRNVLTWNLDIATCWTLMTHDFEERTLLKMILQGHLFHPFHYRAQMRDSWATCCITVFSACSSNHFVDHLDRNGKPDDEWSSEWMIKFMVTNLWQNTPSFHKLKSCWQHDAHAMCSACSARDVAPKPACGIAWYREINHWHCMFVEGLLDILWQIWSAFMSKMILIFWIGKYFFVPFSQFWLFIIKGAFLKPHACWTKFVLPIWNHMLRR